MKILLSRQIKQIAPGLVILLSVMLFACNFRESDNADMTVPEWTKFNDPVTGHEVWQITNHDSISEAFYFYAPSFTADDKYAIFRSKRHGDWDVYRFRLDNGEILRLTDEGIAAACMHPNGEDMVYISDWKYFRLNLHTLENELMMDLSGLLPAEPGFRPTFTSDGRYTLVTARENDTYYLYRIDFQTNEIIKVLERTIGRFSHALIHPTNPDLITYAPLPDTQNDMSLPMNERPRANIIRLKDDIDEPFLITPYGFRATHDSWSQKGDRYFFFEKSRPDWTPVSIASIDIHGEDYRRHYTDDNIRLGHGTVSQDGLWFISDSQDSFRNPLILLNLADGKTKTICWPDASVNTEANVHVHPNFSSSGNYVIYTSDVAETDKPQVYIVPVQSIKENW